MKKYMKIQNPKILEVAYQDSLMVEYPYMTQEQLNSSLDILEASTGVRPGVTFKGLSIIRCSKKLDYNRKKIAAKDVLAVGNQSLGRASYTSSGYGGGIG